jgi:plastocyanin
MNPTRLIPILLALAAVPASAPAAPAQHAPAAAPVVHISNFTFGPQALTIRVGQTVTWVNDDDIPHAVAATGKAFKSKVFDTGDRFSFTFAQAGSFAYFCSLHPHMTGMIVVTA